MDALDPDASQNVEARPARFGQMPLFLFIRGIAMLLVMTTIVVGAHFYIGARLIDSPGVREPWHTILWSALWFAFASIFVGFIGRGLFPRPLAKLFQWVGFGWLGAFGLLLTSVAVSDAVRWALSRTMSPSANWPVIQALAVLAVVAPALVWGFFVARKPVIEKVTVPIAGLHPSLDGLKVVQISDVHIGETLDGRFMRAVVERVNALQPDIVAVTGDLIDGSVHKLRDEVAPLGGLTGRHGVYYVTGNHEYYSGADAWESEVARLGLTVLHNQHRVVSQGGGQLVVAGVTDVEGKNFSAAHRPDLDAALQGAPKAPVLLLAHQPRFAKQIEGKGVSLMLSGHTHGGQIFPFMFFVKLQQPVIAGLRTLWGTPVYTNRGTGYWGPPFRIGPTGEITELTLKAA